MENELTLAFNMTMTIILALCLICAGALLISTLFDTRTYYQIRGIKHKDEWIYTIDKGIRFGKPNDNVYEKNYLEVWFRSKDQAEGYLLTLQIKNGNRTFKQTICNTTVPDSDVAGNVDCNT